MARNAPARTPRSKARRTLSWTRRLLSQQRVALRAMPATGKQSEPRDLIDLRADIRMTFSARRTLFGVDTRDFEKFFTSGLLRGFFGLGRSDQITAARDLYLSSSIGKQPVTTDSYKTFGEDVEQDAAG